MPVFSHPIKDPLSPPWIKLGSCLRLVAAPAASAPPISPLPLDLNPLKGLHTSPLLPSCSFSAPLFVPSLFIPLACYLDVILRSPDKTSFASRRLRRPGTETPRNGKSDQGAEERRAAQRADDGFPPLEPVACAQAEAKAVLFDSLWANLCPVLAPLLASLHREEPQVEEPEVRISWSPPAKSLHVPPTLSPPGLPSFMPLLPLPCNLSLPLALPRPSPVPKRI